MLYRKYKTLSNGQVAMFQSYRDYNAWSFERWSCAVTIGDTAKACRMMVRKDFGRCRRGVHLCEQVTGRVGLEGLIALKAMLKDFTTWVDGRGRCVNIDCIPYDEARKRLYAYLLRMGYVYIDSDPGSGAPYGTYQRKLWYWRHRESNI